MNVGTRIKKIRFKLGETTQTFGSRFNPPANRSLVSAWENGRYIPNPERLKQIAELGNTTVDQLLNGDEIMTVDQMIEKWVHKEDVQLIRDVYANEMTLTEFIQDKEEYIAELEHHLSNLHDTLYDLNSDTNKLFETMMDTPIRLVDIKKH